MPLRAVLFLTFINVLNYLDRWLLAAVLPSVSLQFHLDHTDEGLLGSASVWGYFIFSPIFGRLGDRMARPPLMFIGVLLWSLATLATGLAPSFTWFVVARIGVGIGEASFAALAPGLFRDRIEDTARLNRMLSLFCAAIPAGSALGYVTGGLIEKRYGWQNAFFAGALPGLLLCWGILRVKEAARRVLAPPAPIWEGVRKIFAVPALRFAIGGYVMNSCALSSVALFVPTYGTQIGFELQSINNWFGGILLITGTVGTYLGGLISSRLASASSSPQRVMFRFISISALLAAPCLAAAFLVSNHALFLSCAFVAELFVFAGMGPINTIIVSESPAGLVTLTQGVTIFALNLVGALAAPAAVGWLADGIGMRAALLLTADALLICGLLWWMGMQRERGAANEEPHL